MSLPVEYVQMDAALGKMTILTRSNSKITIDDPNKTLTLQDCNGNRIEMTAEGITITSVRDISFVAPGNISMTAAGNVETTARADVKTAALNITHAASVGYVAKGASTAELSASGQTTVKGALVMIN